MKDDSCKVQAILAGHQHELVFGSLAEPIISWCIDSSEMLVDLHPNATEFQEISYLVLLWNLADYSQAQWLESE